MIFQPADLSSIMRFPYPGNPVSGVVLPLLTEVISKLLCDGVSFTTASPSQSDFQLRLVFFPVRNFFRIYIYMQENNEIIGSMIPKIIKASYAGNFTIHVVFTDGAEGDVDLKDELYGDIFEELKDQSYFSKVFVHPEFHTLCWPNGTDIAPEFLYDKLQTFA